MRKVEFKLPRDGERWGTLNTKHPSDSVFVDFSDFTAGSKNFDTDDKGVITKRLGGTNYNPSLLAATSEDQFEAIFSDGVHHLLVVEGGRLNFSSGDTLFTTVTSGYAPTGNFEFAMYLDRVYFGNGIDLPQVYDRTATYGGVGYSAPRTKDMGAQAPSTTVTAAVGAAGNVPAGGHTYKVTFLYYDFEESNGSSSSNLVTPVVDSIINLTSVPTGGYGVTDRKIYRDDNDGVYRLVGNLGDNTTTTFNDNASTGTTLIPTTNDIPSNFSLIVNNLDRNWIAGVAGEATSIFHSEAGLPDIFPSLNKILCNPKDPITALAVYNDRVIIFNRNSMGQIVGRTSDTFRYAEIPSSVGCVDNRSIQIRTIRGVPVLMWLSDKGFYTFNGNSVNYISDQIEDLVNFNIQQASQVKGQNTQTTQADFLAGTSTPGIDLTSIVGSITQANPERIWDDQTDWEGGSSLTNVVTRDGTNTIKVPTKFDPTIAEGTLNGAITAVGNNLKLPTGEIFTGESLALVAESFFTNIGFPDFSGTVTINTRKVAAKFIPTRSGTLTKIRAKIKAVGGGSQTFNASVYSHNSVDDQPDAFIGGGTILSSDSPSFLLDSTALSVALTGGTSYWLVIEQTVTEGPLIEAVVMTSGNQDLSGNRQLQQLSGQSTWTGMAGAGPGFQAPQTMVWQYTYISSPTPSAGQWTSNLHDTASLSVASGLSISTGGTYPAGTSVNYFVEGTDDATGTTIEVSDNIIDPTGIHAISVSGKRYWRIRIELSSDDDTVTPTVNAGEIRFSTTTEWISEGIDHTTDITSLDALIVVKTVPGGTTVTEEVATSADDVTYTTFGPIGSAVVQRYTKVKITMTASTGDVDTPTVTSVTLQWSVSSNLVSSAIDTGISGGPPGWDIFQTTFTTNGGTATFEMRTASTVGGLTSATYVTVTNGQFPAVATLQFAQWRVTLTSSAGNVPIVESITVNWFISSATQNIRVASLFFDKTYYLAAAEFNETTNNILIRLNRNGKWRVDRGLTINTLSLFFNDPYYGSATNGQIVRFLEGDTDQGTNIEMDIRSKAFDFNNAHVNKILRWVRLIGLNTGAIYTVQASFDEGATFVTLLDAFTGLSTFTTTNDNSRFIRKFILNASIGQTIQGKTILYRVLENSPNKAQIHRLQSQVWIRQGDLVS